MSDLPVAAFFVYGTLMRGQENFAACARDALTIRPAATTGTLYHLHAGFPVLVDTGEGRVIGEIMTFPSSERTVVVFDELEGYNQDRPEDGLYVRVARVVEALDGGASPRCWTYVVPPDRLPHIAPYAIRVPDGDWAAFVKGQVRTA